MQEKKKLEKEEILKIIKADIDTASEYYETYIKPAVEENFQLYKGDQEYYETLMPQISKRSKFVSTDIADAVEAMLAQLMKIFFGNDEVVSIEGRTAEDLEAAEVLKQLCNYQVERLNDGFMTFYRWFKDALVKDYGVLKVTWERQYEYDKFEEVISIDELEALRVNPDVEITEVKHLGAQPDANGLLLEIYRVKYKAKRVVKNQPRFEVVPYYEFLFDPNAKDQSQLRYAIHRKLVTADYLRKKQDEGVYKNVEKAIAQGGAVDIAFMENIENYRKFADDTSEDDARKYLTLYEYWGKIDVDGDGRLEDVVCTVVGDVILSLQENTLGNIPFAILSPIIENDSPIGKGFASMLAQLQNLKTMLIKELAYNIALANDGRMFVNQDFVNINDLLSGAKYIRTKGNIPLNQIVMLVPFGNIHGATFNALEYIDTIKESRAGITRYNQGLDARSLNKTATGINLIMQAANQRMELIARIFAETGIKRFYRLLLSYNLRFIDQEQVIRLINKPLQITEDFEGKFDYRVNAGVGVAQKQETVQILMQLLNLQLNALAPIGLAKPENIYNTMAKLLELVGIKNVNDFVADIKKIQQQGGGVNAQPAISAGAPGDTTGPGGTANQGAIEQRTPTVPGGPTGGMQEADLQQLAAMLQGGGVGGA